MGDGYQHVLDCGICCVLSPDCFHPLYDVDWSSQGVCYQIPLLVSMITVNCCQIYLLVSAITVNCCQIYLVSVSILFLVCVSIFNGKQLKEYSYKKVTLGY